MRTKLWIASLINAGLVAFMPQLSSAAPKITVIDKVTFTTTNPGPDWTSMGRTSEARRRS